VKELSEFYKNKTCRLGVMARCKDCVKKIQSEMKTKAKPAITEKVCGHCNVKKPIAEYHKLASRKDGYHPNCKPCKDRHRYSPVSKYTIYKNEAERRGYKFGISFIEFKSLWQKPCEYCGSKIDTIGLDRPNNDVGYVLSNIKICCKTCNYMKRSHSFDEWIQHMKKIISYTTIERGKIK